ncbi:hypothetical protein HY410_00575 [Candidatus Gottesmanbacteria bacterium]|nr:hypothetical protein [Candidatus Gottesmanbacteria bacterium]
MAVGPWQEKETLFDWALTNRNPSLRREGLRLKTASLIAGDRREAGDPRAVGLFPEGLATTTLEWEKELSETRGVDKIIFKPEVTP